MVFKYFSIQILGVLYVERFDDFVFTMNPY